MNDVIFTPASAPKVLDENMRERGGILAKHCLDSLSFDGECFLWVDMNHLLEANTAVGLLAQKGWDSKAVLRQFYRASTGQPSTPRIALQAQTPKAARKKLQRARTELDAILTADVAHWRRRWRLSDWHEGQNNPYVTGGLDQELIKAARKAYKERHFAQANDLFDAAFAQREAFLAELEATGTSR